jgi:hypothetical protein
MSAAFTGVSALAISSNVAIDSDFISSSLGRRLTALPMLDVCLTK